MRKTARILDADRDLRVLAGPQARHLWLDELQRTLRHGARLLRLNPALAATAVLTLALCIGANTAIFSVVDAVLLRPLPYPDPERLGEVVTEVRGAGASETWNGQSGL